MNWGLIRDNLVPKNLERRTHRRFSVQAPILFRNISERPGKVAGGFTKNLSASGLYLLCEESDRPRLGNDIEVEVLLPSVHRDSGPNLRLKSRGRVERLNSPNEPSGCAVATSFGYEKSL